MADQWYGDRQEPARNYIEVPPLFSRQETSPVLCSDIVCGPSPTPEPWRPTSEEAIAVLRAHPAEVKRWFLHPQDDGTVPRSPSESNGDFALRVLNGAIENWMGWADDELSDAIAAVHGEYMPSGS